MIRRPRRSVPAAITALIVLALCVAVAVATIQTLLGQAPFVRLDQLLAVSSSQQWNSVGAIVAAVVAAVLGVILLLAALRPGKPTVLPLARLVDHDGSPLADAGVRRQTLAKDLTAAARAVNGVSTATVSARRATVTVTVVTASSEPEAVPGRVSERLTERLGEIAPARLPRVRVRARPDRNT